MTMSEYSFRLFISALHSLHPLDDFGWEVFFINSIPVTFTSTRDFHVDRQPQKISIEIHLSRILINFDVFSLHRILINFFLKIVHFPITVLWRKKNAFLYAVDENHGCFYFKFCCYINFCVPRAPLYASRHSLGTYYTFTRLMHNIPI